MQNDTLNIRHLGLALVLYILGSAMMLYAIIGLITSNGGQLINWVMTTRPIQAATIPSSPPKPQAAAGDYIVDTRAGQSMVTYVPASFTSSKTPDTAPAQQLLALNAMTGRSSKNDRWGQAYTEPFDQTVQMRPDGRFSLSNVSGDITVKSWGRSEVRIQAKKVARADDEEEGKEMLEQVEIEVDEHGGNVAVRTVYPDRRDWWGSRQINVSVTYEVTVPERAAVRLHSVSGSIDVAGLRGEVEAKAVSGSIVITDIANRVHGESVSGDIAASRLTGDAELVTVSGHVDARVVKGDLEARSTSGRVDLRDVTAGRLSAHSTSGSVTLEGPILKGGSYDIETMSGEIRLIVPSDAAFDLRAQAFSGDIDTDLPITLRGPISSGQGRRRSLNGTVNGGGALVTLSAFSGQIQIKTK